MSKHLEVCEAPICQESFEDDFVWYPGEKICIKKPFTMWQKKQMAINREVIKGTFKHIETALTGHDLKHRSI